jgi:transposase
MGCVVMEDARPNTPLASLPDDPTALKALVATLTRERDEQRRRAEAMRLRAEALELARLRLEMELLRYKKWVYGPRADRLAGPGDVAQMLLGFGEELDRQPVEPDPAADEPASAPRRRVRRGKGRRALVNFEHLPVTRCEHDLSEDQKPCPCCGAMREKIGEESSWQIEYIPGRFERIEHIRFKYACGHCERGASPRGPQIERADPPAGAIDKGLAGPGLLAFVVTSKFSDYLPLYRLEDIFARGGFEIARSTMSLWCRDVAGLLTPLYDRMVQRVLKSRVIGTDDTVMPMQEPGRGKTRPARVWVYVGDQDHPYTVFDFTLSRARDGPATFLKGYTGTLMADAYGGYDGIVIGSTITRAGCWAHARRKFVDAEPSHPAIAAEAVSIIRTLYAVEERGGAMDAASRGALRRAESAPLLAAFKDRLFTWRDQLLPKHPMARAVGYALNQWTELTVFAGGTGGAGAAPEEFGRVPIDNNASEREMRRIVLNRKNSLFVGNERAGRAAAILSGLASTCRRHAIDPQRYLTQLLVNLPSTPISQLDQWLPDHWKRRDTPPPAP